MTSATTGTVLQTVALTLPAVALYMTVLNELYVKVEKAEQPMSRGNQPVFRKPGPTIEGDEDNILRGFVTVTRSMNGCDFRLAVLSLFFFVLSALVLVASLAIDAVVVRWVGITFTVTGFGLLSAALAWTAYATFYRQYPES